MTDNLARWQALACTLTAPQRQAANNYLVGWISKEIDPDRWDVAIAEAFEHGQEHPLP